MLGLVANRWPIGTSTQDIGTKAWWDGSLSIATFYEMAQYIDNKPLFVKACHQYHEVVKLNNEPTNC